MGRWGITPSLPTLLFAPPACAFLSKAMSRPNFFNSKVVYHDNSREYNIDARGRDITSILRACEAEDITPAEQDSSVSSECHSDPASYFPYLTKKCFEQKRVEAVEAEIQAARKGTAEAMWRTLWNNENLGYLEVEHIDATTLYRTIEKHYGKLPYTERNFRGARSKR